MRIRAWLLALLFAALYRAPIAHAQPTGQMPSLAQLRAEGALMTPKTRTLVAPVFDAIARVKSTQAGLPPPKDDAERLVRMGELDKAPRLALSGIALSQLPPDQQKAAWSAIWAEIGEIDNANVAALLKMTPPEGWFTKSRYGHDASAAAFHIVQHSNLELWRRFVPVLERYAATGEVEPGAYAKMWDRLALAEGRPQRYGTQMRCEAGRNVLRPLEDADGVDDRRRAMGLGTLADNVKRLNEFKC